MILLYLKSLLNPFYAWIMFSFIEVAFEFEYSVIVSNIKLSQFILYVHYIHQILPFSLFTGDSKFITNFGK